MKLFILISQKFQDSFSKLLRQEKVPVKAAFKLRGIAKIVTENCEKYEDLYRQYANEFGERDANGDVITQMATTPKGDQSVIVLDRSRITEYNQKLKDLGNLDVEIPTISIDELGEPSLTPEDFVYLEFISE